MTRSRSTVSAALDLLIFAPVGFAVTAAEEIPRLAAKGRAEVSGHFGIAKMVGTFAAAKGRQRVSRRVPSSPRRSDHPQAGSMSASTASAAGRNVVRPDHEERASWASGPASGGVPAGGESPVRLDVKDVVPDDAPRAAKDTPTPDGLAIPGYDSLAASQVVQRLAGLSMEELAAVGRYEAAHRGRRTILTRVRQLQAAE